MILDQGTVRIYDGIFIHLKQKRMYFWVGCCQGFEKGLCLFCFCKGLTLLMNKYNIVMLKLFFIIGHLFFLFLLSALRWREGGRKEGLYFLLVGSLNLFIGQLLIKQIFLIILTIQSIVIAITQQKSQMKLTSTSRKHSFHELYSHKNHHSRCPPSRPEPRSPIYLHNKQNAVTQICNQDNTKSWQKINDQRNNNNGNGLGLKSYKIKFSSTAEGQPSVPTVTVEELIIRLNKIAKVSLKQSLFILFSVLLGYSHIYQSLGFISFCLSTCAIDSSGRVKVWINSDFSSNHPQSEMIKDEAMAVLEIIKGIKKISEKKFEDFYFYYLRNASVNQCGFKYTLELIKSYVSCTKLKLPLQLDVQALKEEYCQQSHRTLPNEAGKQGQKRFNFSSNKKRLNPKLNSQKKPQLRNFKSLNADQEEIKKLKEGQSREGNSLSRTNQASRSSPKKKPIQIINQFSLAFNPRKTVGECETATKGSQISTTQKSTSNKMKDSDHTDLFFSMMGNNQKQKTHQSQNNIITQVKGEKQPLKVFNLLSLLPERLEEVQSKGQSSQLDSLQIKKQMLQDDEDLSLKNRKKQEIIYRNRWVNKIDDLFSTAKPALKSSRVEGEEPKQHFQSVATQRLDQWAKLIESSMMPDAVQITNQQ